MSIGPISATSFKGLWQVNSVKSDYGCCHNTEKSFVYHPFSDEKVDTIHLREKSKMVSGLFSCSEFDDLDHEYLHRIKNTFVLGEPLSVTAEKYFTEVKGLVSDFGKGFKFLETDEVKSKILPEKTEFGRSEYASDYSEIKKIS